MTKEALDRYEILLKQTYLTQDDREELIQLGMQWKAEQKLKESKMKVLELFSGTECISNAFRAKGHECFTIDWNQKFPSSLHCDIGKLTSQDIIDRFGHPDVIWAAFDCTTFSIAAISHHRRKNEETGNLDPVSDYAKRCDEIDQNVLKIIRELNPKVFIIENPRGGLRKMTWMRGIPRTTTTYCQYGDKRMKPTDFWSNVDLKLKAPCHNGDSCHESAPRGSRTGTQGLKGSEERSMYPLLLCQHIVERCEEIMRGENKEYRQLHLL